MQEDEEIAMLKEISSELDIARYYDEMLTSYNNLERRL
jgi:hypothetical protein